MQDRDVFRVYIKPLKRLASVLSISYDRKTVEVDLSGQGDTAEYSFEEMELMQCTGLHAAKSYRGENEVDRLIFNKDIVRDKFGREFYVDFSARFQQTRLYPVNDKALASFKKEKEFGVSIFSWICTDMEFEITGTVFDESEGTK